MQPRFRMVSPASRIRSATAASVAAANQHEDHRAPDFVCGPGRRAEGPVGRGGAVMICLMVLICITGIGVILAGGCALWLGASVDKRGYQLQRQPDQRGGDNVGGH